jgi:5'-nucleotidase
VVVSGINRGANMGDDITYSGTVAGAMEGTIQGIPSIAVSLTSFDCNDFTVAADFTRNVVLHLFKRKISPGVFLNINVPGVRLEEIEGVSVTFQGRSRYSQKVVKRVDPFKRDYFWICGEPPVGDLMPGSDFDAISRNRISITPLQLSLTCREYMAELEKWDLFKKNC